MGVGWATSSSLILLSSRRGWPALDAGARDLDRRPSAIALTLRFCPGQDGRVDRRTNLGPLLEGFVEDELHIHLKLTLGPSDHVRLGPDAVVLHPRAIRHRHVVLHRAAERP